MQRTRWVAGLVLIAAASAVLTLTLDDDDDAHERSTAQPVARGIGTTETPSETGSPSVAATLPSAERADPRAPASANSPSVSDEDHRSSEVTDEPVSAGRQLGRTRSELTVVRGRRELFAAAVAELEARGNTAAAAHQRARLEATDERVRELEAEERELRGAAAREGTLEDEERGYAEGEEERSLPMLEVTDG